MSSIWVLGYSWTGEHEAGYLHYHNKVLKLFGIDLDYCNHLALQVGDWYVHPFSNNNIKWVKPRVSDRVWGKPKIKCYVRASRRSLQELIDKSHATPTSLRSCYLWAYTLGLYPYKKDCVSWTRAMLKYACNEKIDNCQSPKCLLNVLANRGYRSSHV
jgi:hypothetical protein